MKFKHDFYKKGEYHVCRICETPIAKVRDGQLVELSNKAHVIVPLDNGSLYRFNACRDCAKDFDATDAAAVKAAWESDLTSWAENKTFSKSEYKRLKAQVKPLVGFKHVHENDPKDFDKMQKNLKAFLKDTRNARKL